MRPNPYDEIPYPTVPAPQTHPDRLASIARLFGLKTALPARCRVLEIGCGDGGNLIPMAYALPGSRFTGIDLSARAIATGDAMARALGLANITLEAGDLLGIRTRPQQFDFILAHGVYSWISPGARESLMEVAERCLAPRGVAFLSYNTRPGAALRDTLRAMLLLHVGKERSRAKRLGLARAFLEELRASTMLPPSMHEEAGRALERGDAGLRHEYLATYNHACWFHEFAGCARRHGLQYLGEAEPRDNFEAGEPVTDIERQQHLDFLRFRGFRQTLLCRAGRRLQRDPGSERMDAFLFSAAAAHLRVARADAATTAVAGALRDSFPLPLPFDELLPYAGTRESLREILFSLVAAGRALPHVYDFPCEEGVSSRPRASRLARFQARDSRVVVNLCHREVELDEIGRQLLLLLDGTRSMEELARTLAAASSAPVRAIRSALPARLEWMARMALLEPAG